MNLVPGGNAAFRATHSGITYRRRGVGGFAQAQDTMIKKSEQISEKNIESK